MMVLCSNHLSRAFVAEVKKHDCRLGWIMGPTHYKNPKPEIPFALDNDAFIQWTKDMPFNPTNFWIMMNRVKARGLPPLWVLVPDSVANRKLTLERWHQYAPACADYGWPIAFAVQDGMTPKDVPERADVVFVGGTTEWKWVSVEMWCKSFPRVHVGRVNGLEKLWKCQDLGAESCDGSGFLREGFHGRRANGLKAWLHLKTNPQRELFATPTPSC